LFLLWSAKRILQERFRTSVCKHYELVNLNVCGGKLKAVPELDLGLQKEASRLKATYKKLRREAKDAFESNKINILLYENEFNLDSSATNVMKITSGPVADKENSGFKLQGICLVYS